MTRSDCYRAPFALLAGALALAGCQSTPPQNTALTQAQQAYSQASSDPVVARYGATHLQNAQEALTLGEASRKQDEPKAIVDHYAYIAQTETGTAGEVAKLRVAAAQASNSARVVTLPDMLFQTGKADLSAMGAQPIQDLATFLKNNPSRSVAISGYTDSTGSPQFNQKLSIARAQVVRDALVSQGVDRSRISIQGYGPSNPIASNSTAEGRQKNRRVDVAFANATDAAQSGSSAVGR
jgi:outer membrane protein OmpA-like peptidoglycan-associated protein